VRPYGSTEHAGFMIGPDRAPAEQPVGLREERRSLLVVPGAVVTTYRGWWVIVPPAAMTASEAAAFISAHCSARPALALTEHRVIGAGPSG
jgi:hypothetical protein